MKCDCYDGVCVYIDMACVGKVVDNDCEKLGRCTFYDDQCYQEEEDRRYAAAAPPTPPRKGWLNWMRWWS
jgi:hypothetical protein